MAKQEPIKVRIARLENKLSKCVDNLEKAIIVEELEQLKREIKEANKKTDGKLSSVSEAPSIMDRKKAYKPFNGHNFDPKAVNGVYENSCTVVTF